MSGRIPDCVHALRHEFSASQVLKVVSVIRRNPDRTWHGDMLDGLAFVKAQRDHGAQVDGARALLVGAGGAGSAIAIALLDGGVRELVIHVRRRRHRRTRRDPLLAAAQVAGCKTANGGHMVQAVQDLMVDFMLGK